MHLSLLSTKLAQEREKNSNNLSVAVRQQTYGAK